MLMIVCDYDIRPASLHAPPAPVRGRGRRGALVPPRRRALSRLAAGAQLAARGARDRARRPALREGPETRPSDSEGARARGEGAACAPFGGRPRGGGAPGRGPSLRVAAHPRHPDDLAVPPAESRPPPPRPLPAPGDHLDRGQDRGPPEETRRR